MGLDTKGAGVTVAERYWLVGADPYRAERARRRLSDRLGLGLEVRRADGREDLDDLALWLRSTGFFAAQGPRLLFWDHPDTRALKGAAFEGLLKSTAPDRWLAIWVDKGTRPEGFQDIDVSPLRGAAWDAMVRDVARDEGMKLDPTALSALARACHPSGHQVVQALRVLKLAGGDRTLTAYEVERLVPPLQGDALYRLTDALMLRDAAGAYRELQDQLQRGAEPVMVLGAMSRQMSQLASFMQARSRGESPALAAEQAGIRSFQTRTYGQAAAVWSKDEIARWFDRAHAVDRALKSSRLEPETWLPTLVLLAKRPEA